jgi:hypothetical protein
VFGVVWALSVVELAPGPGVVSGDGVVWVVVVAGAVSAAGPLCVAGAL